MDYNLIYCRRGKSSCKIGFNQLKLIDKMLKSRYNKFNSHFQIEPWISPDGFYLNESGTIDMRNIKGKVTLIIGLFPLALIGLGIWFFSGYKSGSHLKKNSFFTIGMIKGTAYKEIAWSFQRVAAVKLYRTADEMWIALEHEKVDAVINDKLKGLAAAKYGNFDNLTPVGNLLSQEFHNIKFNPADNSLRQALKQALLEIMKKGIYNDISEKYFGVNPAAEIKLPDKPINNPNNKDDSWDRIKRTNSLILAMAPDNLPFSFIDKHGEWSGFDVEIAWEVSIQLGIRNFHLVPVKKSQVRQGLINRIFDAAWGGILTINKRSPKNNLSIPYCVSGPQLFVRKNSEISGPETLVPPVYPEPPPKRINIKWYSKNNVH